jgi:vancomycin resistance protein YoaR
MQERAWPQLKIRLAMIPSWEMVVSGIGCGLIISGIVLTFSFFHQYQNKIYPHVFINNQDVGGLTTEEARQLLIAKSTPAPDFNLALSVDNIIISSTSAQLETNQNLEIALNQAYQAGRSGNWGQNLSTIFSLNSHPVKLTTPWKINPDRLLAMIESISQKADIPAEEPAATLGYSGSINSLKIMPGKIGRQVQIAETLQLAQSQINFTDQNIEAKVASVGAELFPEQITAAQNRAKQLINKKAKFQYQTTTVHLNDQQLVSLLAFPEGVSMDSSNKLMDEWEKIVNRPPQNTEFEYDPQSLKVNKFVPHRDGLKLNRAITSQQLAEVISELENNADQQAEITKQLTVEVAAPEKSLAKTNNLGIKELIGFGESYYAHSIPGRIHNVALTTSRINNTIVKPGEEFSFNKTLGDVSSATGYKPAYVIQQGKTVLGDGGGVCQVSSTTFRALLNAGLNITKRKPHSYRVSYYELNSDPGFDATVFSGDTDLRFINDTGNYLIIHGEADSERLYMKIEIYGTSDGRKAEVSNYKQWGYRPALPTQYFPDASLPHGKLKQIDWSASGINASFVYTVKDKDGKLMWERTYESHYQPWAAKYLQGV